MRGGIRALVAALAAFAVAGSALAGSRAMPTDISALSPAVRYRRETRLSTALSSRMHEKRDALACREAKRDRGRSRPSRRGYAQRIRRDIERHWRLPPGLTARRAVCEVEVGAAADGTVSYLLMANPCGSAALSRTLRDAILSASPLPLPADCRDVTRHVILDVRLR